MKKNFLLCTLILSWTLSSFAVEKTTRGNMPEPTTEQREKMAVMHEDMAKCLRTNKTMEECHTQMMKECPMGQACGMMGQWKGKGKGMMGKTGTGESETTEEKSEGTKKKQSY
ncbi:MAG: hypothetical protein ACXVCY_05335 [Pseudobdellovibrionaceae bacterium]